MEGRAYLPLVSGQLIASAFQDPEVQGQYEVGALCYAHEPLRHIEARHPKDIDVAAFSVSLWNEQLALEVARRLRARHPEALVVFGGCQVPFDGRDYLARYPFIDLCVRGEGETTFKELLQARANGQDYTKISGLTIRDGAGSTVTPNGQGPQNLDVFPSPYLEGTFDALVCEHAGMAWQAIIETNRGCPFSCAFCYWGNALNQKYRLFSVSRVDAILQWISSHKIQYVFNADANFGMIPQDQEILSRLIHWKQTTGYPEKFRTCWGKNSNDKIYQMAKRLHDADMDKSLTLSRQSQDPTTLQNVHRSNIRLDTYAALQQQANRDGVPVYSELIFGMPGETEQSWLQGLEELLHAGVQNQIFVYHCEILPNTAMADPAYLTQHGIVTQRVPLQAIHCQIPKAGEVEEFDRIIVSTATMPPDTWRRLTVLNWLFQLFHGMKCAFYPMVYLQMMGQSPIKFLQWCVDDPDSPLLHAEILRWQEVASGMQTRGAGRAGTVDYPGLQGTWWEQEEISFLHLMVRRDEWREELGGLLRRYVSTVHGDPAGAPPVWGFQWVLWPDPLHARQKSLFFADNTPEALQRYLQGLEPLPVKSAGRVVVEPGEDSNGNMALYAERTILRGRKSGTLLHAWRWESDPDASTTLSTS